MKRTPLSAHFYGMPKIQAETVSLPLSSLENRILEYVHAHWPTSSTEVAELLQGAPLVTREEKRLHSSRISYHIQKLVSKQKLISKRMGNALVVWPYEVESLRVMHGLMIPVHVKEPSREEW